MYVVFHFKISDVLDKKVQEELTWKLRVVSLDDDCVCVKI